MTGHDIAAQQKSAMEFWNRFELLPAVRDKRVYVLDDDTVSRLGPRLYQAVETIAGYLRPELFTDQNK